MRVLVIIAILATAFTIYAEELPIELFQLPEGSVPAESLIEEDGIVYYADAKFTGISYEKYNEKQLKKILTFKKGLPHGPTFEWYNDGQTLLSANYKKGRLNGQYLAWYPNGTIIYNLMFRNGKLNFDPQLEADDSREESINEDAEQDGEANNEAKEK